MLSYKRLLRKTKAVVSPGMKPGESREEYQKRYLLWWARNHSDLATKIDIESLATVADLAEPIGVNMQLLDGDPAEANTPGTSYQEAFAPKPIVPKKLGATRAE